MSQDRLPDKSSRTAIDAFIRKAATLPRTGQGSGRLIFAMDATASREPTWDSACHLQAQMFEETSALGGLSIQLVYYRGFRECRASPWVASARELHHLMGAVQCVGGYTQIGKVLRHAIRETGRERVQALVFVGDCFEEDVDAVCQEAGRLGLLGVPVFMFQEGADRTAAMAFRQIARLSNGAYCPFDSGSARQLRDLLGAVAVYASGGRAALRHFSQDKTGPVRQLTHQLGD